MSLDLPSSKGLQSADSFLNIPPTAFCVLLQRSYPKAQRERSLVSHFLELALTQPLNMLLWVTQLSTYSTSLVLLVKLCVRDERR